ncbi:hypothetical protein AMTRI_Chr11g101590 [Amborella trichopoda]
MGSTGSFAPISSILKLTGSLARIFSAMKSNCFLVQIISIIKWMRSRFSRGSLHGEVSLSPLLHEEVSLSSLLPDDLVIEILLHFPVESLMDFKCLNKTWKELLLSPLFARIHHLSPSNTSQYFSIGLSRMPDFMKPSYATMFKIDNLEGIECSQGMLCCLCRTNDTNDLDYIYFEYTFIIINPVNGIYTTISESLPNVNLFGFYFDSNSYDFKILAQTSGWTEMGKYHIFDSRIGNWRIIKLHPSFQRKSPCLRMLSLHSKSYLTEEEDSLIVFDMKNEGWSQISLPPRECLCSLIAFGYSACFIGITDDHKLVGWILKKEDRGWEWEELINQHDHKLESWFYPVFFYDEDKLFLQNRVSLDIFIYHVNQKQLEPVEGHRHRCKTYSLYKPTLFAIT